MRRGRCSHRQLRKRRMWLVTLALLASQFILRCSYRQRRNPWSPTRRERQRGVSDVPSPPQAPDDASGSREPRACTCNRKHSDRERARAGGREFKRDALPVLTSTATVRPATECQRDTRDSCRAPRFSSCRSVHRGKGISVVPGTRPRPARLSRPKKVVPPFPLDDVVEVSRRRRPRPRGRCSGGRPFSTSRSLARRFAETSAVVPVFATSFVATDCFLCVSGMRRASCVLLLRGMRSASLSAKGGQTRAPRRMLNAPVGHAF